MLQQIGTFAGPWETSTNNLVTGFGFSSDPTDVTVNFADGLIDDLRMYNRVLTDGGVSSIGETAGGDIAELFALGNAASAAIPEPTTFALGILGLLSLGMRTRRRRRR